MKKRSLSWKHAAGLSLHLLKDNLFRAVITVVLLGVCCAAFGVCICAYGHDYMGTQAGHPGGDLPRLRGKYRRPFALSFFPRGRHFRT